MGIMQGQMTKGGIKSVDIEYIGQFPDLDLKPITITAIKGLLSQFVQHEVNSVNAISLANGLGIKISEATSIEVIPEGYLALIHNLDKPGSIGSMGVTLGKHNINISRMTVGREDDGDRNIIFLSTDTPVTPEVIKEIEALPLVISMTTFNL